MANANERLTELKTKSETRLYVDAREAAGFTENDDYDTWLVLEELRKLTLAERKAVEEEKNPPKSRGGLVTNVLNDYAAVATAVAHANIRGPAGGQVGGF
jgi:hypothetical protein